jgi:hypothetical protein
MNAIDKKNSVSPEAPDDKSNWSHDIEERDYYYDDSTGYEIYDPDDETDDEIKDDKDATESSPT